MILRFTIYDGRLTQPVAWARVNRKSQIVNPLARTSPVRKLTINGHPLPPRAPAVITCFRYGRLVGLPGYSPAFAEPRQAATNPIKTL